MLVGLMCAVCVHESFAKGPASMSSDQGGGVEAGDLVPWPWGTECPFPWNQVDGSWEVKGRFGARYDRHRLEFESAEDVAAGVKLLYINHYNQRNKLVGQGVGYSNKENKIIKAVMTDVTGVTSGYQIIVRSYAEVKGQSCRNGKLSVAVTFCPRRSKRCQDDQHYLLVK